MTEKKLTPKFLTPEIAKRAFTLVKEITFDHPEVGSMFKRMSGHLVILVPSMRDARAEDYPNWPDYAITPHLLYEESVGDREKWEHLYADIARCKALQLWHDRNDDRTDSVPHLLFPGDTPYWGGVKRRGIVVAFSGVQAYFDKMISGLTADFCVALAHHEFMGSEDRMRGVDFLT